MGACTNASPLQLKLQMDEPAIWVDQLHKTFDSVVAVDHLSFQVNRGEIFGMLGPNGAGKTTAIRILMDIVKPDSGTARVLGEAAGAARERIGYLPEERGLYRGLRVEECLTYLAELKGVERSTARERAAMWLERVELTDWANKKVQELSRGMQQKVQIIASLIHDPQVVILDEPFQGLDPVNVEVVKNLIRHLSAEGKTIALSAHEMNQVEALCNRILLINHGRAVLYGALAEIKKQFAPNAIEISPPLALQEWPEVTRAETHDGIQTIYLHKPATPHDFLRKILDRGLTVDRFEMASMPLDQIFIQVVKGE
jgi:ABC-2 type transport system ATP-binding protein